MTIQTGSTVWGVRLGPGLPDHWEAYQLGQRLDGGAAGSVLRISKGTAPPLVAKIYNGDILNRVRTEKPFRQRIIALAMHRAQLMQELPFAFWPRRILFDRRDPDEHLLASSILGFSMAALPNTISLATFLEDEAARIRVTHADNIYVAQLLADRIARLHAHPWSFVFGDMSPNNIHVSLDFTEVYFIDTDGFQFRFNSSKYAFTPPGLTPSYRARGAQSTVSGGGLLNAQHDEFVLAIFIFQILLAQAGYGATHPFRYGDSDEDANIAAGRFPYLNPTQYPVPLEPLRVYQALPPDIQSAFQQTFTTPTPFAANRWPHLLAGYRRGLQRKTA